MSERGTRGNGDLPTGLGAVERAVAHALAARALDEARQGTPPTPAEARALARMAAHMRAAAPGEEPRAPAADGASGGRPHRTRVPRRALVAALPLLALVGLGALWRGVRERLPATGAPDPESIYLGGPGGAAGGEALQPFPGSIRWDSGGRSGLVRVAVFDLDAAPDPAAPAGREPASETFTEASEWSPEGPLPARFQVLVDRPADDGFSREVLHCAAYARP